MSVECFLLEESGLERQWLRRFCHSDKEKCTGAGSWGYHNAKVLLRDALIVWTESGGRKVIKSQSWDESDPRWPVRCEHCDYEFAESDCKQVFRRTLYKMPSGDLTTIEDAPPGAMWFADWMLVDGSNLWRGPDGRCLAVKCPGGHQWMIDGRASNCTLPNDNAHKCWVRHGTPPKVTVGKDGLTCQAGAGSIQTPNWHGFLREGLLVE